MASLPTSNNPLLASKRTEVGFLLTMLLAVVVAVSALIWLLSSIVIDGFPRIDSSFLTSYPSRSAGQAGIFSALVGSAVLMLIVVCTALPVGLGAAIYLEEFSKRSRLDRVIELNIANLAGVPSIIYGLLGLHLFVQICGFERSLLAGGLTLSLLVLPIIIITSREAIRAVPQFVRDGGLALGATHWQIVWHQVLPLAFPGVLTGSILALSRAIGETAPLVTLGALTYVAFVPDHTIGLFIAPGASDLLPGTIAQAIKSDLLSPFTALPIQAFNWLSRPQQAFHVNAAAAICVLLSLLLVLNATAIYLRVKLERKIN